MKLKIVMFTALLLAPLLAQAAKPLVVEVSYVGQGHYLFKKKTYDHTALVQVIQAKYQDEHIAELSVHVVAGASLMDRRDICLLRGELGTKLKMHVEVGDGTTREQFCN
ncbi:MAG TPA: hypothetical protein VGM16_06665 [Gammaproteobacteria bacterium]|jgi:hypothetical protein